MCVVVCMIVVVRIGRCSSLKGAQVFTDMIKAEYEDFGPWEIRTVNYRD